MILAPRMAEVGHMLYSYKYRHAIPVHKLVTNGAARAGMDAGSQSPAT
jgi:hypothetical protein